jgi:cell division protein FtsN
MKSGNYEVVLEERHLLSVFFAAVLLCALFFALGFVLGRSRAKVARDAPASPPATAVPAPAAGPSAEDLSFYGRVEEKRPPVEDLSVPAERSEPAASERAAEVPPAPAKPAPGEKPASPSPSSAPIYLQVAAFAQEPDAKRLAQDLLRMGFPALVVPPSRDKFYRVQVGPFTNSDLVGAAQSRLEAQGFRPILRR